MNSKSDPKSVQDALHETAVFPGNFNLKNGYWESTGTGTNSTSTGPRTKLVFDSKTHKLLAVSAEKAMDGELAIAIAAAGWYCLKMCFIIKPDIA